MMYLAHYPSPLGDMLLAERDGGLAGLWLEGQKYYPDTAGGGPAEKETPLLAQAKAWLDRYFAGERPAVSELKLTPAGGEFRQTVWRLLCEIPYGETVTYGALAEKAAARLGKASMSAQAVGGAVAHNPISVVIPCHRVVGADGSLTGYAGGLEAKRRLLALEGADLTRLYAPKKGTAL